ncbi:uncharacterized protein LOC118435560 [Folsomia candida]|uniref:uncharacterized protein LOC118435560 n=1 Tax=Folsomia candida TaxID=158441 RepID=UPI001604B3BD|nr:uncharacterized protein LOC118435560 [Folsomia candida]
MILIYERRVFNTKEKHYNKVLSSAKFLKCALQLLGLCGSMFLQIFVILLIIMKAGRPPFIGSIIPDNKTLGGKYSKDFNVIGHLGGFLIEFWQYSTLGHLTSIATANVCMTSIFCLFISLRWTMRIDKVEQEEGSTDPYLNQLEGYIQLKIIEAQMNACFRRIYLPGIFFVFGICNVTCSYFCVPHVQNLFKNVDNFVFVCVLVETVLFILLVVGLCGMLNKKSEIMLNKLRFNILGKVLDRELVCKRVRGCSPFKIRFGSNFVDVLTPLRMMVLCIRGTVRLLLLQ